MLLQCRCYRVIFLTGPSLNLLSVGQGVTDFKKDLPPLGIENVKVFRISPLSQSPYFFKVGGASLETFSGEAQLKKSPCYVVAMQLLVAKPNQVRVKEFNKV